MTGGMYYVFFLVLVYVFNFDLFGFSAAILEKGRLENVSVLVIYGQLNCATLLSLFQERHASLLSL